MTRSLGSCEKDGIAYQFYRFKERKQSLDSTSIKVAVAVAIGKIWSFDIGSRESFRRAVNIGLYLSRSDADGVPNGGGDIRARDRCSDDLPEPSTAANIASITRLV